jgi:hypothetical protein
LKVLLAALLLAAAPALAQERLLDPSAPDSARGTALTVLKHLAAGELEQAAAWSNAPYRRFEVLRDYRDSVGEEVFKRAFGRFLEPESRLIAEVAIGPRRLLVWALGGASGELAGQFYVEVDGRFLLDDVPSRERDQLRRVLNKYRKEKSGSEPDFR